MDHFESHEMLIVSIPQINDSGSALSPSIYGAEILKAYAGNWKRFLGAKSISEVTATKKLRAQ